MTQTQIDPAMEAQIRVEQALAQNQDEFLWKIIDPSKTMDNIAFMLRGYKQQQIFDEETGTWVLKWKEDKHAKVILSDEAIGEIIALLRWRLGPETTLSKLKDTDISRIARDFEYDLNDLFLNNFRKYKVTPQNYRYLVHSITDIVFTALKKAEDGALLRMLKTSTQLVESYTHSPKEKRMLFGGKPTI